MLTNNQKKLILSLGTTRGRKKSDSFLCEGKRSCLEAVNSCPERIELAVLSQAASSILSTNQTFPVVVIEDKLFSELSSTSTPQGILLVLKESIIGLFDGNLKDDFVLVLDRVTDPGNFGTIIRAAWAAGLKEIWYTVGTTDPYSAKSVRSGMGAHFAMTFRKFQDLAEVEAVMTDIGGRLCLTKPLGNVSCFSEEMQFSGNAVVMGNEANGIEFCSDKAQEITIPMPGNAESLNVAAAATIVIFEYVRRIS